MKTITKRILFIAILFLFSSCDEYYTSEILMIPLYRETLFPFSEDDISYIQDLEFLSLDNPETISLLKIIKEMKSGSKRIKKIKRKSIAIEIEEFDIHSPSIEEEVEITERVVNVRVIIKIKVREDINYKLVLGNNPYNLVVLNDQYYVVDEEAYKNLLIFLEGHSNNGFLCE